MKNFYLKIVIYLLINHSGKCEAKVRNFYQLLIIGILSTLNKQKTKKYYSGNWIYCELGINCEAQKCPKSFIFTIKCTKL